MLNTKSLIPCVCRTCSSRYRSRVCSCSVSLQAPSRTEPSKVLNMYEIRESPAKAFTILPVRWPKSRTLPGEATVAQTTSIGAVNTLLPSRPNSHRPEQEHSDERAVETRSRFQTRIVHIPARWSSSSLPLVGSSVKLALATFDGPQAPPPACFSWKPAS